MTRAIELLGKSGEDLTLSSGVTVHVVPFPADLNKSISAYAFREFPDPIPPKKTIQVVDGTEEVDNLEDADYLADKVRVEAGRSKIISEAFIDLSVNVDLGKYNADIKRVERYTGPYPDDPTERKLRFLTEFAIRTVTDYQAISFSVMQQSGISEEDVAERLDVFRPEMARAEDKQAAPSRSLKNKRVDV